MQNGTAGLSNAGGFHLLCLKSEVSFGDPKSGDFENLFRISPTFPSVCDGFRLVIDRKCDFLRSHAWWSPQTSFSIEKQLKIEPDLSSFARKILICDSFFRIRG